MDPKKKKSSEEPARPRKTARVEKRTSMERDKKKEKVSVQDSGQIKRTAVRVSRKGSVVVEAQDQGPGAHIRG